MLLLLSSLSFTSILDLSNSSYFVKHHQFWSSFDFNRTVSFTRISSEKLLAKNCHLKELKNIGLIQVFHARAFADAPPDLT